MIINWISNLGNNTIHLILKMGRAGILLFSIIFSNPDFKKNFPLLIKQIYALGVQSLSIISLSGLFIGMVLGLQGYLVLIDFAAETNLGLVVSLSLLRELGPVVAALLFTGRACSALTAEIGLMKATEQLSALEMMAVNPIKRIIYPRFWAGMISMPILTLIFIMVGIIGSAFVGVIWKGIDSGSFWAIMQNGVHWGYDIGNGIIKSLVFSIVVLWIALFNGYDCIPTSEGISHSTTKTVVYASLSILVVDFVLTAIMFGHV